VVAVVLGQRPLRLPLPQQATDEGGCAVNFIGRVITKGGINFTVTSQSTHGEICVWDSASRTLLRFAGREEFEHWAYGTPVPSGERCVPRKPGAP